MRKIAKAISVLMIMAMLFAFSGCGAETTKATLEDIASSNTDITKTIKEEMTVPKGTSAKVEFSGDSFDVTYTFEDSIEDRLEKRLVDAFDENEDSLKEGCEKAIEDLQKQTDISGITGTIHIVNSSGKEIWSVTYPEQE